MMQKIAIFFNPNKAEAAKEAESLQANLEKEKITAIVSETKKGTDDWGLVDKDVELIIALGGDGTFLLCSKQALNYNIPVLGVNFGHLGFLSEYGDISMENLATAIAKGDFSIEARTVLKAELGKNKKTFYALNDIAVNRSLEANLLYTDLYIDDNLLHSFRSDGIVICTPTGSTAYALSAGGAVMDPNIHAFQIVPIAAHSLNSRPHVVSDEQLIMLESKDVNKSFFIQADGHDLVELEPGTKILIKKAERELKLVKLKHPDRSFYSILRDKMKWGAISN